MNHKLKLLLRDTLILLALMACASLIGVLIGQWWKSAHERAPVEPFSTSILPAQLQDQTVLISRSTCPACKMAKSWLAEHQIPYQELVLDQDANALALAKSLEISVVPTFLIGEERVNGFQLEVLQARFKTQMLPGPEHTRLPKADPVAG